MNKIEVGQRNLDLPEESIFIENINEDTEFHLVGHVRYGIKNIENHVNLHFYVEENSFCTVEFLGELNGQENKITIENGQNSNLKFHFAAIYKDDNHLVIESNHSASNVNTEIQLRLVEQEGSIEVLATGNISEEVQDIQYLEDIKVLTEHQNRVKIMPDLFVSSYQVQANHNATISSVPEDSLFYLKNKGLETSSAKQLIEQGFLKGIIEIEELK